MQYLRYIERIIVLGFFILSIMMVPVLQEAEADNGSEIYWRFKGNIHLKRLLPKVGRVFAGWGVYDSKGNAIGWTNRFYQVSPEGEINETYDVKVYPVEEKNAHSASNYEANFQLIVEGEAYFFPSDDPAETFKEAKAKPGTLVNRITGNFSGATKFKLINDYLNMKK